MPWMVGAGLGSGNEVAAPGEWAAGYHGNSPMETGRATKFLGIAPTVHGFLLEERAHMLWVPHPV